MSMIETWYWKYTYEFGIYNEYGELIGMKDNAPPEVKKAFEEDMEYERKIQEEAAKEGYLISF